MKKLGSVMSNPVSTVLTILLAVILLGCSSGVNNPVAPNQVLTGDSVRSGELGGSRVLWGIWNVSIDSATSEISVTPLRGAAFTANVTRFMQPPVSPANMVSFAVQPGSVPGDGYFIVDVSLKHPFPGLNQYNGFDVRGIFMADGSITGEYDPDVVRSGPDDAGLLNADGYTRWWNWQEFTNYNVIFGATQGKLAPPVHPTATVNPYKYFADGLGAEDPMTALYPESRGFFTTNDPGVNTRRYELQFLLSGGKPVLSFNYAVDASWELPDESYAPDYPVEAFPISANCNEAFFVGVTDAGSSAYYAGPSDFGGNLLLDIEVFDWQGGAKGDVPSEVAGLYLEGDIFTEPVDVLASATVLPGSTVNSSVFEVSIGSLNLTESGEVELFGTVENTDPNTFKPQLAAGDLFAYPDSPLAAYFTCTVTIGTESPGPDPTVTGIDPDEGIPDCTPEFVTVSGTDFATAATFRLEMSGQPDIEATDIEWIDSNTLTGYLDLLDTLSGVYDVVVENPGGVTGVLEDAFTILDVLYVDGDNAGDPSMNGTMDHPFDTIQKGIDAAFASANQPVIVDQSASDYATFNLKNNSHVIGCNWNDGVGWPTVSQTNVHAYGAAVSNATIEGLFFNITISSGSDGMVFNQGSGLTLRGCKFSGQVTAIQGYFVRFSRSTNVEVDYCEFTNIYQRGSDTDWRSLMVLVFGGTNGVSLHHSEFHHIGYDIPDAGAFGDSLAIIRVGYDTDPPHNVDFHHILIYDIFDKTNCIRPSPNPDPQNWLSVFSLSNVNSFDWVGMFKLYNVTVDDIRNADPPETTIMNAGHCNAAYMAMVGGDVRVWKNNIASNIIPTDDNMWSGNSSYWGWWVDNYVQPPPTPQPMDYSNCFNIGKPLPNGANSWQWTSGYVNQCMAGTGSYQNYQDIDPQYDMTPGDNFYHPTNTQISQGADDGSEMGAFGGPDGDWIPPSQM